MQRIKIFDANEKDLQKRVNRWIKTHKVTVISMGISQSRAVLASILIVLYTKKRRRKKHLH